MVSSCMWMLLGRGEKMHKKITLDLNNPTELHLSSNKLTELPSNIGNLINLKILLLYKNK